MANRFHASYQCVLATGWLKVFWQWILAIGAACMAIWMTQARLDSMADWGSALPLVAVAVLSFLSGWFASIIPAWFVFGPLLRSQGIENGGPLIPGDRARILAGKHRGTIARVYGMGQHETVRVELGEAEKEQYTDFFSAYELVRDKADDIG